MRHRVHSLTAWRDRLWTLDDGKPGRKMATAHELMPRKRRRRKVGGGTRSECVVSILYHYFDRFVSETNKTLCMVLPQRMYHCVTTNLQTNISHSFSEASLRLNSSNTVVVTLLLTTLLSITISMLVCTYLSLSLRSLLTKSWLQKSPGIVFDRLLCPKAPSNLKTKLPWPKLELYTTMTVFCHSITMA